MTSARGALPAAGTGVVLMTLAGIDSLWGLVTNREPSAAPDAAATGTWLLVRLVLFGVGGVLVLAAAWMLWRARDAAPE